MNEANVISFIYMKSMAISETLILKASLVALLTSLPFIYIPLIHSWLNSLNLISSEFNFVKWGIKNIYMFLTLAFTLQCASIASEFWSDISISQAAHLPTLCRVLSSDVDLRTARNCALPSSGNVGVRPAAYMPPPQPNLNCRFIHYWTSVFKVEFRPHNSPFSIQAFAECPHTLLPLSCRPDFNRVWKMKEMYLVNSSYLCYYSPFNMRNIKFDIQNNTCKERMQFDHMVFKSFYVFFLLSEKSIFSIQSKPGSEFWCVFFGVTVGIMFSLTLSYASEKFYVAKIKNYQNSIQRRIAFLAAFQTFVFSSITLLLLSFFCSNGSCIKFLEDIVYDTVQRMNYL